MNLSLLEALSAIPSLTPTFETWELTRPETKNKLYATLCTISSLQTSTFPPESKFLHPLEQSAYQDITNPRRRHSYLLGKICAKLALLHATSPPMTLKNIAIVPGIFRHPVITGLHTEVTHQVSITHSTSLCAAIAFPEIHPMGIDCEKINPDRIPAIARCLTPSEKSAALDLIEPEATAHTLLWTTKESLSKCTRTGLMTSLKLYETSDLSPHPSTTPPIHYHSLFTHFPQYQTLTRITENHTLSITLPKNTQVTITPSSPPPLSSV